MKTFFLFFLLAVSVAIAVLTFIVAPHLDAWTFHGMLLTCALGILNAVVGLVGRI